jgi:hypothetical protein
LGLGLLIHHLSLDDADFEIVLLLLDGLLELYLLDLEVGLGLDDLLLLLGEFLLQTHLLLLGRNEEVDLDLLHILEVLLDSVRNVGFGDSNGQYLYSWRPPLQVQIQ